MASQRVRWHHGLGQALMLNRGLMLNPRGGTVSWLAIPFYVLFELLGPVIGAIGFVFFIAGAIFGLIAWADAVVFLVLALSLGMLLSICAIMLEEFVGDNHAQRERRHRLGKPRASTNLTSASSPRHAHGRNSLCDIVTCRLARRLLYRVNVLRSITMKNISAFLAPVAAAALAFSYLGAASAAPITCGSLQRFATFDSAESCRTGEGNPRADTLLGRYPGEAWTAAGELNGSTGDGTNGFLTLDFTSGRFDSTSIDATWSLASSFWSTYSEAVFSIHVGNGNGSPDYFAWLVTPGETAGTLSYDRFLSGGGGFSNARLWGRGVAVPEPGALTLLGAGLAAILVARRRRKAQ